MTPSTKKPNRSKSIHPQRRASQSSSRLTAATVQAKRAPVLVQTKPSAFRRSVSPPAPLPAPEPEVELGERALGEGIPARAYDKTEATRLDILAALDLFRVLLVGDLMPGGAAGLHLTRSNATYHLRALAAEQKLYIGARSHRGQLQWVAARTPESLAEMLRHAPRPDAENAAT